MNSVYRKSILSSVLLLAAVLGSTHSYAQDEIDIKLQMLRMQMQMQNQQSMEMLQNYQRNLLQMTENLKRHAYENHRYFGMSDHTSVGVEATVSRTMALGDVAAQLSRGPKTYSLKVEQEESRATIRVEGVQYGDKITITYDGGVYTFGVGEGSTRAEWARYAQRVNTPLTDAQIMQQMQLNQQLYQMQMMQMQPMSMPGGSSSGMMTQGRPAYQVRADIEREQRNISQTEHSLDLMGNSGSAVARAGMQSLLSDQRARLQQLQMELASASH